MCIRDSSGSGLKVDVPEEDFSCGSSTNMIGSSSLFSKAIAFSKDVSVGREFPNDNVLGINGYYV